MRIDYIASQLDRLIKEHEREPISTVSCNAEEFDSLQNEAEDKGIMRSSDTHWFSLIGYGFSIHLDYSLD